MLQLVTATLHATLAAIALIAGGCGSIIEAAKEREPFAFSPTYFGHKLADLPANPTIDQQTAAGRRQVELFREKSDPMLDTDRDLHDYFDSIVQELVKHSPQRPPYPIRVHESEAWTMTVIPLAGGQIIVSSQVFRTVRNEAELVGWISSQTAHLVRNDFLMVWNAYMEDEAHFVSEEWRERAARMQMRADELGAQMMYAAGWDPKGMLDWLRTMYGGGNYLQTSFVRTPYGLRQNERMNSLENFIESLPPKAGLIKDSERFQEFKRRY